MLLTLGLHKNSLVRSYSEHRILTPKIPKQSGKTVVTILVTTVSIFRMVLSASRRLPCGERPDRVSFFVRHSAILLNIHPDTRIVNSRILNLPVKALRFFIVSHQRYHYARASLLAFFSQTIQ